MRTTPKRLRARRRPGLTIAQILAWADAHHTRTGQWPNVNSGTVKDNLNENWRALDLDFRLGLRGLPGGTSLVRVLASHRGVRNPRELPALTVAKVLSWADAHHARTGQWPTRRCGPIPEAPGETWETVFGALLRGTRSLSGGSSLADLLAQNRGKRNHMDLPRLRVVTILAWADAHWARTGNWPTERCGPVIDAPGEKWSAVDIALEHGSRGLPGGSSLPRLLAEHRGVRNQSNLPHLRVATILGWADAHHARTGQWPKPKSGPIRESPDETWYRVHTALIEGLRGLPGGSSLPQLLARERGVRNRLRLPKFRVKQIVQWAIEHHERTGTWPRRDSGPIASAPGETWSAVANALTQGGRGLSGGSSLPRVLDELAGRKNAVPIAR